MLQAFLRGVLCWLALLAFYQGNIVAASLDSEIVEAETTNPSLSATSHNSNISVTELPKWHTNNDTILVRPYNILEASCPHGYVLVNKHCHKRVRDTATTMQ